MYISRNVADTIEYAKQFSQGLKGGETILLIGDLGAGKTHFAKGIALGLDVTDTVTSPTFTLHNVYYGRLTLNHFDFYRLTDPEEAVVLGLNEYFSCDKAVAVIEWSENVSELLPSGCITVSIKVIDESARQIDIIGI
ncbi:MAG: tRNA (adenosine(37)-N6)-threonylcarbamoyltransferase complex ATPase subunit type 1 TsaE [Clostridia bacterium]